MGKIKIKNQWGWTALLLAALAIVCLAGRHWLPGCVFWAATIFCMYKAR